MPLDPASIRSRFNRLPTPRAENSFSAETLRHNVNLGVDASNRACILFELEETAEDQSWRFGGIELNRFANARIASGRTHRTGPVLVAACQDFENLWRFAVLAAELDEILKAEPHAFDTTSDIREHIAEWARFFSRTNLDVKEALGLWGELEVLLCLGASKRSVECWHGPEAESIDFFGNGVGIEVKTAVDRPVHWFSLDQTRDASRKVFVASVLVREDPVAGLDLDSKVAQIRRSVRGLLDFDRKLLKAGYAPGAASEYRFRCSSVSLLPANSVPRPRRIDDGVCEIRFSSDLSEVPRLSPARAAAEAARLLGSSSITRLGRAFTLRGDSRPGKR